MRDAPRRLHGSVNRIRKNSNAAKAALKINYAARRIVNPALKKQYGEDAYQMRHVVGVDTSKLFAARIGVHKDNDLVWVGRAANYAAKLCSIACEASAVFITDDVFRRLNEKSKYGGDPPELMWTPATWDEMGGMAIHRSTWTWGP